MLKLHPGNEDVLDRCSSALAYLCYDSSTAEQIADQGAVEAVLTSIDSNVDLPSESSECCGLICVFFFCGMALCDAEQSCRHFCAV